MGAKLVGVAVLFSGAGLVLSACFEPGSPEAAGEGRAGSVGLAGVAKPLVEAVKAETGTLKNPYTGDEDAIGDGRKLYLKFGCNGCHGGEGGGGLCPPLTNDLFAYGSDDDTLFRLIALGSKGMIQGGFVRDGGEPRVGSMAPYTDVIESDQKLWKIIAFIRSIYAGAPERRDW